MSPPPAAATIRRMDADWMIFLALEAYAVVVAVALGAALLVVRRRHR